MFLRRKSIKQTMLNSETQTDAALIADFRLTKNQQIIGELFNRYGHLVFGLAMKYLKNEADAKDAGMMIFESLPEKLIKYEVLDFKNWLYSVTKNQCLMMLRQSSRQHLLKSRLKDSPYAVMELAPEFHLHEKVELELCIEKLYEALSFLKSEQRTCVELMYLEQKSYFEIAEETGYSMKKVKSHIQNGKRNLKLLLEK